MLCTLLRGRYSPFVAPKKYFDLYNNVSEPTDDYPTKGMPEIAWSNWGELRNYADIAKMNLSKKIANVMPEQVTIDLRKAYYAATSFTSFQIGRVLQAIDNLGLRDDTVVAMVGDHGESSCDPESAAPIALGAILSLLLCSVWDVIREVDAGWQLNDHVSSLAELGYRE